MTGSCFAVAGHAFGSTAVARASVLCMPKQMRWQLQAAVAHRQVHTQLEPLTGAVRNGRTAKPRGCHSSTRLQPPLIRRLRLASHPVTARCMPPTLVSTLHMS
jgi:hypothetical protein